MSFVAAFALWALLGQDEIYSGPQKGEKAPGFTVFDVASREEVDPVGGWEGAPGLIVFIHEVTRPGAQLMRPLDDTAQIKKKRGLKALFVSLPDDRDEAERRLPVIAKAIGLKSPLSISVDGKEGPGAYGLNRKVTMTILVVKDGKVHANFAILSPNETDAPKIKKAIDEVLAAEAPTGSREELAAEVVRLRAEVVRLEDEQALAQLKAKQASSGRMMNRRRGRKASAPAPDAKLSNLIRRLIQREASDEEVDAAVKDLEAYVAGNDGLKKQYADNLGRIVKAKYGTEHAQAAIKAQLEKYSK